MSSGWTQIAVAAIGSYAASRDADRRAEEDREGNLENIGASGSEARRTAAYQMQLADYYDQQSKGRARKSLANFGKWSNKTAKGDWYSPEPVVMPDAPETINYANPGSYNPIPAKKQSNPG
jgi:hypothetical protein